jgi:C-terminal processing protease CtpA/Prc
MKPVTRFPRLAALLTSALMAALLCASARAQSLSTLDRDRGRAMLETLRDDIRKNYYDPAFRGIDLDEHFRTAEEKIRQATSLSQVYAIVEQALMDFDDSHLYFIPPPSSSRYEYGWRMQMVGDKCFVTGVKPGSDGEKKGLQAGDQIVSVDGFEPTRDNHWKMLYYYGLRPKRSVKLSVRKPGGEQREYEVFTKVTTGAPVVDAGEFMVNDLRRESEDAERERREGSRQVEVGDGLLVWKMSEFDLSDSEVDDALRKARKYKSLILDLRGNGGGAEQTLLRMLGGLFDHDVNVGEIHRRKESMPLVAKTRGGDNVFKGDLVVLIDSHSGSASELFARAVQLEKRGTIVGDRSAGAVMRARLYGHSVDMNSVFGYGASITDADILMADGKSLEHTGVEPDHWSLPTGADMAAGRDRVLTLAAALVGVKLEPEKAGALFPLKWKK